MMYYSEITIKISTVIKLLVGAIATLVFFTTQAIATTPFL